MNGQTLSNCMNGVECRNYARYISNYSHKIHFVLSGISDKNQCKLRRLQLCDSFSFTVTSLLVLIRLLHVILRGNEIYRICHVRFYRSGCFSADLIFKIDELGVGNEVNMHLCYKIR